MSRRPKLGLVAYEYPPLIGGMATYARALVRHMQARGYDVHVFANRRGASDGQATVYPILTTDLARDLPRLARFDMDLWHAINFGYAPLAVLKRPFVLTVHGTDFLTPWVRFTMDRVPMLWRTARLLKSRAARRVLYSPALRFVDQVLACSRFSAQRFRHEYPSVGRLEVIPNGADDGFFRGAAAATHGVPRHPRRVLTVCNLDVANRRKNVDGLVRAMAQVGERLGLEHWIVGDGPERPALERLAAELGIDRRVRFLGRLSSVQLREAYASSSLLAMVPRPRAGDVEGFGIVYLEAAAAGTPSLASRCGGAPEAVAEGRSGFFADDPSPAAIADAITRFFTGQVRFDPAAVRAHAARHTWPTVLARVERVYERLLRVHPANGLSQNPENRPAGSRSHTGFGIGSKTLKPHRRDAGATPVLGCTPSGPPTARVRSGPTAHPAERSPALQKRAPGQVDWATWIKRAPTIHRTGNRGRALLISYMFPPTGGSAVQRPAKLVKYLPEFGWSVEVLTAAHDRFPWSDESLLRDVAADCRVHRVPGYEPACLARAVASVWARTTGTNSRGCVGTWLGRREGWPGRSLEDGLHWRLEQVLERCGVDDSQSLWVKPATRAAIRRHRRCPFDVVITTGPPHFAHEVGMRVAQATGLPWVADVRDPLIQDFDRTPAAHRRIRGMQRIERAIMRDASTIVTTCPALAEDLVTRYPQRFPEDVHVITNGFDRDDLLEAAAIDVRAARERERCVFLAAGAFYGRREMARMIDPMSRVLDQHAGWRERVRLVVAGTLDGEQRRRWERDRPSWMELAGYIDHDSAIRRAAEAACTIVLVPDCRTGRQTVPGKVFELLALPTHLLALVPRGSDTERIVQAAGAATVAPMEDEAEVARAMERIISDHQVGRLAAERDWSALDVYDRRAVASAFAECLASACSRQSPHELAQRKGGANEPRASARAVLPRPAMSGTPE